MTVEKDILKLLEQEPKNELADVIQDLFDHPIEYGVGQKPITNSENRETTRKGDDG